MKEGGRMPQSMPGVHRLPTSDFSAILLEAMSLLSLLLSCVCVTFQRVLLSLFLILL